MNRLTKQTEFPPEYIAQLDTMLARRKAWTQANPDKVAQVQFNFPKQVCIVAPIDDAIQHKFVTTNEAGLDLIKALWPWEDMNIPTVLMVRAVLEAEV